MHPTTPKYVKLIETIKDDIHNQVLVANQQLPNEDELAAKYSMSRGTVRKAISELQRLGLVRKEQGRGTFVNEGRASLNGFSLVEFDHYVKSQNRVPETRTLVFEVMEANDTIAEKLDIPQIAPVFHITQLRLGSGVPLVYEERYFAQSLCPDITQDELDNHSLHWLLVEKYNIPLVRLSHTIDVSTLPSDKFDLFKVKEAVPIFKVNRLSFTKHNQDIVPAVWYRALYRADEYHFQAQFRTSF